MSPVVLAEHEFSSLIFDIWNIDSILGSQIDDITESVVEALHLYFLR